MSLAINNNLAASNAARNLGAHYTNLTKSVRRLSSGLRVSTAADDAAGLAIRELMRADITALNQGARNVNDAISMLQTADGALGIIDEKLIRMKELAEQAATGTYNSDQRLMIDSEFQAMAAEIDRIANATDFNGIKVLDGKYDKINYTSDVSVSNVNAIANSNNVNVTLGTYSINGNGYVDKENPDYNQTVTITAATKAVTTVADTNSKYSFVIAPNNLINLYVNYDFDTNSWNVHDDNYNYSDITYSQPGNTLLVASDLDAGRMVSLKIKDNKTGDLIDMMNDIANLGNINTNNNGQITYEEQVVVLTSADAAVSYNENDKKIVANLNKGGTVSLDYTSDDGSLDGLQTVSFDITVQDTTDYPDSNPEAIPNNVVKIHFGAGNDKAEDYYYIEKQDATIKGLGLEGVAIKTQATAQDAIEQVDGAIIKKDTIRAYFGATQNRLENTLSNIRIQAENLGTAESQLSDVDISQEMTNFVRNQILVQSGVAMLAQANALPRMALQLLNG